MTDRRSFLMGVVLSGIVAGCGDASRAAAPPPRVVEAEAVVERDVPIAAGAVEDRVAIWSPLAVGAIALAATILVHTLAVTATITVARRAIRAGRAGTKFWIDVAIVAAAIFFTAGAHLLEIGLWAGLFMFCGEFSEFAVAYYHSAVNYTTLGYGDVIMTDAWKFLGPFEGANGMLLFGLSTALIFAVIQRIVETRFTDLRA